MNWHWLAVYFIAGLASLANTCRFMSWHCLCIGDRQTNRSQGVRIMDTSISIRVDASTGQRSGNNSPHGDRQSRRQQKLQALLQSLKAGELDASRQAFTALVNFDPSVSADPYLSKIGAALQSSNL